MLLLWQIFFLFTRVALFSWGGGPASLALMQRETTSARWTPPGQSELAPWVTPDEFADAVAIGNALPGPIAPQVSAYVGYKLAGVAGAIATVGCSGVGLPFRSARAGAGLSVSVADGDACCESAGVPGTGPTTGSAPSAALAQPAIPIRMRSTSGHARRRVTAPPPGLPPRGARFPRAPRGPHASETP